MTRSAPAARRPPGCSTTTCMPPMRPCGCSTRTVTRRRSRSSRARAAPAATGRPTTGTATAWLAAEYAVLLGVLELAARLGYDAHTWQLAWALDPFAQGRADWSKLGDRLAGRRPRGGAAREPAGAGLRRPHARRRLHPARPATPTRTTASSAPASCTPAPATGSARPTRNWRSPTCGTGRTGRLTRCRRRSRRSPSSGAATTGAGRRRPSTRSAGATPCSARTARRSPAASRPSSCISSSATGWGEAQTWDSLGLTHHHLGQHREAADCYGQALDLYRELAEHGLGDRYNEAATLVRLGDARRAAAIPPPPGPPGSAAW